MSSPDQRGPVLPPLAGAERVATAERKEAFAAPGASWALIVLRGIVFVGGIFCAFSVSQFLSYNGAVDPIFILAQLSLAPTAVAFWILASLTRAADRWTLAYIGIWALEVFVALVVSIGYTLF